MFTPAQRDAARAHVLAMASADPRVVAGAIVGSFAAGKADRWSDLDLTFAVNDESTVESVLSDWTVALRRDLSAVALWDVVVGPTTYRVFLLPGLLQVDLSFARSSEFGPAGPSFELLFGDAGEPIRRPSPNPRQLFGLGVVYAIHGWKAIQRNQPWQAENSIAHVRECALSLACLELGLNPSDGRDFDKLPRSVQERGLPTLVSSLATPALLSALGHAVQLLMSHPHEARDVAAAITDDVGALAATAGDRNGAAETAR